MSQWMTDSTSLSLGVLIYEKRSQSCLGYIMRTDVRLRKALSDPSAHGAVLHTGLGVAQSGTLLEREHFL